MFNYKVENDFCSIERDEYKNTINQLLKKKLKKADEKRKSRILEIDQHPEKYRKELIEMLGWPLTEYSNDIPNAKETILHEEGDIIISKVEFLILESVKFYGLLFSHKSKRLPLVIFQHGASGKVEICSDMLEGGSWNYNNCVKRILSKNVNVFVPQLLLWNTIEKSAVDTDYNRLEIDANFKQLGGSITALEVYEIMKSIDYFINDERVIGDKVSMMGLSYGAFYTFMSSAIDVRIKAALACCWYNDRFSMPRDGDWAWFDSASKFFDNELIRLIYPRYLCVANADNDQLISAKAATEQMRNYETLFGKSDNLDFVVFNGRHEFLKDDEYIEKTIQKLF